MDGCQHPGIDVTGRLVRLAANAEHSHSLDARVTRRSLPLLKVSLAEEEQQVCIYLGQHVIQYYNFILGKVFELSLMSYFRSELCYNAVIMLYNIY